MEQQNHTAPQTGRPAPPSQPEAPQRLWTHLLSALRDWSGALDPFANDAAPQVRALGRAARARAQPLADDYFAIGDTCARLVQTSAGLSSTYAAKTVAAYIRAATVDAAESDLAWQALQQFAAWLVHSACLLDDDESIQVAQLICERLEHLPELPATQQQQAALHELAAQLQQHRARSAARATQPSSHKQTPAQRESRLAFERGQLLLRQNRAADAQQQFERVVTLEPQHWAAWLWHAMACTDLGRYEAALHSYDQALALEQQTASIWNSKGALLLELGHTEAALAHFERAVALANGGQGNKAIYWLNQGKALFLLGRYQHALAALRHAQQLEPSAESSAGIAMCQRAIDASAGSGNV